ncbi:hypothetical protein F5X68DRAFT_264906 [Plectosphaerella plurivora]|uniref:DUF7726 domain-containing protein n=1 Tax=Plectosphaerella plurivora TaxID=936078 RepID=A0A9P8V3G0_9PEZI|nr:hypothetical protein F5X68DRAFT_264906 [Plectosphaerella plurivora]
MAHSWRPWEAAGMQPLSTGDVNKAINLPPALPPTSHARPTDVTLPSISSWLTEPLRDENTAGHHPYEKSRPGLHGTHSSSHITAPQPPRHVLPTSIPISSHAASAAHVPTAYPLAPRQHIPPPMLHHAPPPARSIPPQQTIPTTAPKSTARKRKSEVLEEPYAASSSGVGGGSSSGAYELVNCDHLRDKIEAFIQTTPLRVFLDHTRSTTDEYAHFARLAGPHAGSNTEFCHRVSQFFREREREQLHQPQPQQHQQHQQPQQQQQQPEQHKPRAQAKRPTRVVEALDVSGITLEGEESQSVKVFDTCDKVRRKINRFLADHDDVTASAFCREIAKALPNDRKVQSKQLNDFLAKKGPTAGNTSCVYYTAYVFFEKRRIKDRRPKDQTRLKMEEIYKDEGMNTTELLTHVTVFQGEEPVLDEFGRIHYVQVGEARRPPRR